MNITAIIIASTVFIVSIFVKQSREYLFKLFSLDKVIRASNRVKNRKFIEKGYIFNSYLLGYMCLGFFVLFEVYILVEFFTTFDSARIFDLLLFSLLIFLSRGGIWTYFKISGLDLEDEAK